VTLPTFPDSEVITVSGHRRTWIIAPLCMWRYPLRCERHIKAKRIIKLHWSMFEGKSGNCDVQTAVPSVDVTDAPKPTAS